MKVLDYLGIIDTNQGVEKLYKNPVVVAKVDGDVYAAVDTETGNVKYYPFWASMTKFNIGGFFIVTLSDQISDKIKNEVDRIMAKKKADDPSYAAVLKTVRNDIKGPGNMVAADERLLKEAWKTYNEYDSKGLIDKKKYVNCF